MDLKSTIRAIPDYPKPGIIFRDVTTLMGHSGAFTHALDLLTEAYKARSMNKIAGIEARGFIFGAALADRLGIGFVPVRKLGKLPHETYTREYQLEYGQDTLEVHKDAVTDGETVLIVDDLLATGGTAVAAVELMRAAGAHVTDAAFVVELPELGGRAKLDEHGITTMALTTFEGH